MNLRDAIESKLKENYTAINSYTEQAQNLKRPAFSIIEIEASQEKSIGGRYWRETLMAIRYFPAEDQLSDYAELTALAYELYHHLEYVEWEDKRARGSQMRHRIEDNVLQVYATYREALGYRPIETLMETLEETTQVKE
ncbi:hypothetical protein SDC9_208634 [bioreactor metagenome]|uniref:Phage protein n=1 Tax=bioreactor metagenome TaxID=1076179 RepID=A0A645JB88_9ZZZZ